MNGYLTEKGAKRFLEAEEYDLSNYYDMYMGNFQFTENELFENMNTILMWLEEHEDYALIHQGACEGGDWFLTPQETL